MRKSAVVILNYNGTEDTISCISSFYKYESKNKFTIIIVDNNSCKDKVINLKNYITNLYDSKNMICEVGEYKSIDASLYDIVLVKMDNNLGFAKGNNFAVKFQRENFQYFILLNNDTELVSASASKLVYYLERHDNVKVVTSAIYYYSNSEKIWNAGGKIFFGTRKYYTDKEVNNLLNMGKKELIVDFVTGCYFCIRSRDIFDYGIFTERFFHGEEDYNYAMKAKQNNEKMVVLINEKLLHKVGATSSKGLDINNVYGHNFPHHLNRFIDMKEFYGTTYYLYWTIISSLYIFILLLIKYKRPGIIWEYVVNLNKLARKMNGVSREEFLFIRTNKVDSILTKYGIN